MEESMQEQSIIKDVYAFRALGIDTPFLPTSHYTQKLFLPVIHYWNSLAEKVSLARIEQEGKSIESLLGIHFASRYVVFSKENDYKSKSWLYMYPPYSKEEQQLIDFTYKLEKDIKVFNQWISKYCDDLLINNFNFFPPNLIKLFGVPKDYHYLFEDKPKDSLQKRIESITTYYLGLHLVL